MSKVRLIAEYEGKIIKEVRPYDIFDNKGVDEICIELEDINDSLNRDEYLAVRGKLIDIVSEVLTGYSGSIHKFDSLLNDKLLNKEVLYKGVVVRDVTIV